MRPNHLQVIVRITQCDESDECVEHRREDRSQAAAAFETLQHPSLSPLEGLIAERMETLATHPLGQLVQAIEPQEHVP